MQTENSLRYARRAGETGAADNIIYFSDLRKPENYGGLEDYRTLGRKRSADRTDTLWNVIFIAACLSVLAVLFLH